MPIDTIDLLTASMRPEIRKIRYLDNHYHLEMIARDSSQVVAYQREALKLQHEAAVSNIRGMAEIASRQDMTNELLSNLLGGVDYMCDSLDALNATAERTLAAVNDGFTALANHMIEHRKVLDQISYTLRHPYEAQMLELLAEADSALKQGMGEMGRDQQEGYKDATRLLGGVLQNPVGSRNYVAWFQTGWLHWKYGENIAAAEEGFYQASRLSAPKADAYHSFSLRHLAYMQYKQDKFEEAYATIHKAIAVTPHDHDVLYDAARYAAKTSRTDEATSLLDKCIDLEPQTIVTMFSEEDFLS